MGDITVRKKHGLEFDEAKSKVKDIVSDLQQDIEYIDKVNWNSDQTAADVKGKGFSGNFSVDQSDIIVDIDLKFFAKPFKGKIEEKISQRMDEYFS
jgi:putative polyhydroxyalkanoate system protein